MSDNRSGWLNTKACLVLWGVMIFACASILFGTLIKESPPFNAGLLSALEIDAPENQAAISLSKNYQNKLLLLIGHPTLESAVTIASDIRSELQDEVWIESIYSNPLNSNKLQQLIDYYGQSPYSYLGDVQKEMLNNVLATKQNNKFTEHYFSLLNQWADPVVSHSLPKDMTLTLATFLKERLLSTTQGNGHWKFYQQELMLEGSGLSYIPIFINVKANYTNIRDSVEIYQTLLEIDSKYTQAILTGAGLTSGAKSEVLMTGMVLHSAQASLQAQSEISSFGLFSLIGVIIIILLAFRALSPLIACIAVIGSALLVGVVALILWFESIHLLAFVFAVSILGIAVDYGFHVLVLNQQTKSSAVAIRKKVFLPLTIALVSTIVGYSLFFTTPITLLHQVVVFVGFGLLGAYLSALLLLPSIKVNSTGLSFSALPGSFLPKQNIVYLIIAGIIFTLTVPELTFDDNIGNLNTSSPQLINEDRKVAQITGENVYPYMVVINAGNKDDLLQKSLHLTRLLRADGAKLKSITDWQLPLSEQRKNIELVQSVWLNGYARPMSEYIDPEKVETTLHDAKPIPEAAPFVAKNTGIDIKEVSGSYWTALLLQGALTKTQAQILEQNANASYVNLPVALSNKLADVRQGVMQVALPAMLLILIILSLYFGFVSAFTMLLVPTVSAGLALGGSQFVQGSLNIFNVLACLLIVTLSIDYSVFFRAHGVSKLISHTITLSALSSALTFGVMSYSTTPAVSSFGLTLLLGICSAWLLSHLTPLTYIKKTTMEKSNDSIT